MLLQGLALFVSYLVFLGLLLLFLIILVTVSVAVRHIPIPHIEERNESLHAWWKWINTSDPHIQTIERHAPKHLIDKQVESWLCPNCGSKLSKQSVQQLEFGYDVECGYCGTVISTSSGQY